MSSGRSSVPARRTPRRRARASAAALVAAIVLSGCGANDDPGRLTLAAFGSGADAQHERGRAIYNFRCYYCHGYSGDAKTLAATFLDPPPRDFTGAPTLNRATIALTVRHGRPGTGMAPFAGILDDREIDAVAAFVEQEFVKTQSVNTRYHTAANGWPDHDRYADAYPFVQGEVALDTPPERLDGRLQRGRKLFSTTCISCHDRARVTAQGSAWETRPLSAPRSEYAGDPDEKHDDHDEIGPYAIHDVSPKLVKANAAERRGERIYRDACQMCHAADGTGKNWIGSFLEPHPTDLTDRANARLLDPEALARAIATGKPETSMPAFASVLTRDEIASLGAYIRRVFGAPTPAAAAAPARPGS